MIKKTLLLLTLLASAATPSLYAQQKMGSWIVYPRVADTYTDILETPDKVYMLSGGTLSHRSFDDDEFYVYTGARLSEGGRISGIYYNQEGKYLLAAYENGNIDLIYDNGKVVNLPEIKDAVLTTGHGINHVSFSDGKIYVAAQFGIVIYDDQKHEVIESGLFDLGISHIFVIGDYIMIREDATKKLLFAPVSGRHNQYSVFTPIGALYADTGYDNDVAILPDGRVVYVYNGKVQTRKMSFEGGWGRDEDALPFRAHLTQGLVGVTALQGKTAYYITETGVNTYTLPEEALTVHGGASADRLWLGTAAGVEGYAFTSASPSRIVSVPRPEGFTADEPSQMVWSKDGRRLYVTSISANFIYQNVGDNFSSPSFVDKVENGTISDVAVHDVTRYTYPDLTYDSATGRLGGTTRMVEDPDDPSIYYIASNGVGLVAVKDNDIVTVFNKTNSLVPTTGANGDEWWRTRVLDTNIDPDGNLWLGVGYEPAGYKSYSVLPAAKRRGDLTKITRADWLAVPRMFQSGTFLSRDGRSVFLKKWPGYAIFAGGEGSFGFVVYNTGGTYLSFTDDTYTQHTSWTDTEGNTIDPYYIQAITEDANGYIWMGTDQGVFYFTNPAEAFNADFRVKRPIVPRNDGTIYGDYLLEGESVFGIACDPSNRKWLATASSGVYLVNADGTKILAHYTAENSSLPSNIVESVACDPFSNRVYFGTPEGVVAFDSDSSPAADDYSEVYAYPNPVRPDYTGYITVAGLMDNSLVKIADVAGNVFYQGRSEGGMISWDGCGPDGRRVRSGVYFVFASQNDSGSSSGAVTKIMIVN